GGDFAVEEFAVWSFVDEFGAGEDAGQGVVVARGDGIELVVMATRAGDSQAEEGTTDGIDAIFPFIGFYVEAVAIVVFGPEADKPERGQILGPGVFDFVGRKLEDDKAVVTEVRIESVDGPFTILEGVRIGVLSVVPNLMRMVFGIAGQREPEAGHAFAESR